MDRRAWLRQGWRELTRALAGAVQQAAEAAAERASGGRRFVRPPGALPEPAFLLTCSRCGQCAQACPKGAIRLLGPGAGAAAGTPHIDALQAPCHLCLACTQACPTGALERLQDPRQVRMARAEVDPATCWAHQGRICDVCYWQCPFPGEALKVEGGIPAIDPGACTGCGICAHVCPSTPPAIRILPLGA